MSTSIWFSSAENLAEHPQNNACDFINELNAPMDFSDGRWRVAAGEIIYENNFWQNVRQSISQVELTFENLQVQSKFMDHAVITGDNIIISPKTPDNFPPTHNA